MSSTFPVNSHRLDPYKNFKFRVKWDGREVAGISKVSAIKVSTEAIDWREGKDSSMVRKVPGRSKCEPVTLERGLSHDRQFIEWVRQVTNPGGTDDGGISLKAYRKPVTIDVHNLQGHKVMSITLNRAWPSEFQAVPELDANANAIAIQTLKLECEGFTLTDSEPQES